MGDEMPALRLLNKPEWNRDGAGSRFVNTAITQNKNYQVTKIAVLPPEIDLEESSEMSVAEQLGMALTANAKTIRDLFADWDADGNGGISKKEFRKAIKLLGYNAKKADIDKLFDELNAGSSKAVEDREYLLYEEMQKQLRKYVKAANAPKPKPPSGAKPEDASPRKA